MPETTTLLAELSRWAQPVTAWMLTYLLHSTLLLGGAWLLSRVLGQRRLALQETAWKVALLGGIVTAGLQLGLTLGLGVQPWAGQVPLSAGVEALQEEIGPASGTVSDPTAGTSTDAAVAGFATGGAGMAAPQEAARVVSTPLGDPAPPAAVAAPRLWPLATAAAWLAVAGFGLLLLALGYARLHRCLAERRPVTEGALPALFGRLLERAGLERPLLARRLLDRPLLARLGRLGVPGLTASPRLPVPIAWGIVRREVSLPEEVVEDLSPYHQESILAHEISHLRRHDPAWLALGRVLETALFFQPLNRLARRRLQEIAEYRCDDGAVALTGRPVELARCLTEVASWRVAAASRMLVPGLWVPGMTTPAGSDDGRRSGSALAARVRRILSGASGDGEKLPRLALPAAAAVLLTVALAAPGVIGQEPAPEPPPAPEAPEASEAGEAPETPESPETPGALEAPEALQAPAATRLGGAPALPSAPRSAPAVPRLAPRASVPAVPRPAPLPAPDGVPTVRGTAPTPPALPGAPAIPAVPAPDGADTPLPNLPSTGALPAVPRAELAAAFPAAAFRVARFEATASPMPAPAPSRAPRADSTGLEAEIDRLVTTSSDEERRAVAERLEAELDALQHHADAVTDRLRETGADAGDRLEVRLDELEVRYDRVGDLLEEGEPDRSELRGALTAAFAARNRVQHELERLTVRLEDRHQQRSAEVHDEARRQAEERAQRALERAELEAERARREREERMEARVEARSVDRERLERQAELRAREMERATEKHREAVERRAEELEAGHEAMERDAERRIERRAREMERHAAEIARLSEEARHAGPSGEEMERLRELEARERARMAEVRAEVEARMAEVERRLEAENAHVAKENARIAEESAHVAALSAQLRRQTERMEAERSALRAELRQLAAGSGNLSGEERRRLDRELRRQLAALDEALGELSEELGELDEAWDEDRDQLHGEAKEREEPEEAP